MRLSFTGSKGNLYVTVYLSKKDNIWISIFGYQGSI